MKKTTLALALLFGLAAAPAAAGVAVPFGSHLFSYAAGSTLPDNYTQAQLDQQVRDFYDNWKTAYIRQGCGAGRYYVLYQPSGEITVSEAHGYGMMTMALMAGHDPQAQTIFDGMYLYFRDHPSGINSNLMSWQQDASCNNVNGNAAATDGDLDIAFSLLLADRQWGSCGSIDYMAEAITVINAIKADELDNTYSWTLLGDWASSGQYYNSTRSSDFMPDHYRAFAWATGDNTWTTLIDDTYDLVNYLQTNFSPSTGLLPDFIINPGTSPAPANPGFLEANDGDYYYNACRDPWRLATDFVVSGDSRAQSSVQNIITWAKGAPINGNPNNVRAGYTLAGTAIATWNDAAFYAPFGLGGVVDPSNQTYVNTFWNTIRSSAAVNYFGDSIKLLSQIVMTGNWWAPEAMPDPCTSATATPTATPALSASPTPTVSWTHTPGATFSRTASPTPSPADTPVAGDCKIVLAYYPSWTKPAYSAANIPYDKLTHICHAFLIPNADGSLPVPGGFVEPSLTTNAHAVGVKVLVSVGGATGSANFPAIAGSPAARQAFADNVKAFCLANDYDGVDFDWEFPTSVADRNNFNLLVQTLRNTFDAAPNARPEWLITGAYSWTQYYGQYYDINFLKDYVDFFNIMTYDFHGPWSPHSGHNAPLTAATGDPDGDNAVAAINYYNVTRGLPKSQIVFGVPFYGYNFPTEDLHSSAGCCGSATYTAYKDIVPLIGNLWSYFWDASASSPKLRHDSQARTITYDNPLSIETKSDWALNTADLAGVFMWEISQDHLGGGNQPLLDAMRAPLSCGTPSHTPTSTNTASPTGTPTSSLTFSPTSTATPSFTPTNSPVDTPTATPSQTPVDTSTPTPSQTPVDTVTATPTASPSASATATQTPSASATATASATESPSETITTTISPTFSPVPTNSTQTATPTVTESFTQTASPTASPTNSETRTATPSVSPSPSETLTASATQTASWTPTATSTFSLTASVSPSVSPTQTQTLADSVTVSPTLTASPVNTATSSPSLTQSPVDTATATPSASPSLTQSPVDTATATATITGTQTRTATPSATPTMTCACVTDTVTPTPSPSATIGASHTVTATASPDGHGRARIVAHLAVPNPSPKEVHVELESRVDDLRISVFSTGMQKIAEGSVDRPCGPGWVAVPLPNEFLEKAASGTWYYRVEMRRNGARAGLPEVGPLVILR